MTQRTASADDVDLSAELHTGPSELEAAAADLVSVEAPDDETTDPIEHVRRRLEIEDYVPDVTIAASLAQIATRGEARERWLAAFGSPLGKHLAQRGSDLNTALNTLLALAPRHNG